MRQYIVKSILHRQIFGIANQETIERIVPHPLVGEEDYLRRKHQLAHQVEMRLMIADDDAWFVEVDVALHLLYKPSSGDAMMYHHKTRSMIDQLMQAIPLLFQLLANFQVKPSEWCEDAQGE